MARVKAALPKTMISIAPQMGNVCPTSLTMACAAMISAGNNELVPLFSMAMDNLTWVQPQVRLFVFVFVCFVLCLGSAFCLLLPFMKAFGWVWLAPLDDAAIVSF